MQIDALGLEITDSGDVYFEGKKCSTQRSTHGYCTVRVLQHRLVAHAYHGPPPTPRHVCHHIDGNPRNNAPDNLEWISQGENIRRSFATRPRKITQKMVNEILSQKPEPVVQLKDLAVAYGVSYAAIQAVRSGNNWANGWHRHNGGKLTAKQIERIRAWTAPIVTAATVARKYKVSDVSVLNIWHGRTDAQYREQLRRRRG